MHKRQLKKNKWMQKHQEKKNKLIICLCFAFTALNFLCFGILQKNAGIAIAPCTFVLAGTFSVMVYGNGIPGGNGEPAQPGGFQKPAGGVAQSQSHGNPDPAAKTEAGKPISTQALISDAPADNAPTQAPICRLPRKYAFSPPPLERRKKNTPMPSINTKYRRKTTISVYAITSPYLSCVFFMFPCGF